MDGEELSQEDIYQAMNTRDRDTYDFEVTGLRNAGVLLETKSQSRAQQEARQTGRRKAAIARFRVQVPGGPARMERSPREQPVYPESTGVYVSRPPAEATDEQLSSLFSRFGGVRAIRRNSEKGFVVVFMENEHQALDAIEQLHGVALHGAPLDLRRFRAKPSSESRSTGRR
jgi:ATP-dependent DNA helicase RecG